MAKEITWAERGFSMRYTIIIIIFLTITLSGCGDSSGRYALSSSRDTTYVLDTKDGTLWVALSEEVETELWREINTMKFVKIAKIPKNKRDSK